MKSQSLLKQEVAIHIAEMLLDSEVILLGSGSTVNLVIGECRAEAFVSSSLSTSMKLLQYGKREIPLDAVHNTTKRICVDGADQILENGNVIIKGHGGALVREKITWKAATEILVAIDETKISEELSISIPVAIIPFGVKSTLRRIEGLTEVENTKLKLAGDLPFNTDDGLLIAEVVLKGEIDFNNLNHQILSMPGVVETGIFIRNDFSKVSIYCATQERIEKL